MLEEERQVAKYMANSNGSFGSESKPVSYGEVFVVKRREALERDKHTCQECGSSDNLEVHHIESLREYNEPEEAHRLENLKTLCRGCHIDVHQKI